MRGTPIAAVRGVRALTCTRKIRAALCTRTHVSQLVATNSKRRPLTKAQSLALLACSSPFYQFLTQYREIWLHAGSRLKIYYNYYTFDPASRKWSVILIGAHHNEPVLFYTRTTRCACNGSEGLVEAVGVYGQASEPGQSAGARTVSG